ncbi:MAG TPA: isoaspartyl peptidase/L-asparaginase [Flavitalea sp.]|nr:isoaspartyl peptidase/L-asparaginase [Flavitalea sp.]
MSRFTIVIHGGAGQMVKTDLSSDLEQAYLEGLQEGLDAGYGVLEEGGLAVNAVKAAIVVLEDNILFNAGRGSVFTKKGIQEMDAAIMDGKDLSAGSIASVRNVRNPIELAAEVMKSSNHVFLSGKGAGDFAIRQGIKLEPDEYFFSQFRYDQWKSIRDSDNYALDHTNERIEELLRAKKFGTVGAVACDKDGNIAAATSTGGMTNKKYGRIGDSPLIGAGTYANNKTCGISCTGHGEKFIRLVAAHMVSALMEYKGLSLEDACNEVVHHKLKEIGGDGGLIGVDNEGNAVMTFNTSGMYRGVRSSDGRKEVAIYKN